MSITVTTVENKLKTIIQKNSKKSLDFDNINDASDLIKDFEFNSMSIIQLVVDIETEFAIELDDDVLMSDILADYKKLKDNIIKAVQV